MRARTSPSALCLLAVLPFELWCPAGALLRSELRVTRPFPAQHQPERHTAAAAPRRPVGWGDKRATADRISVTCTATTDPSAELLLDPSPPRSTDALSFTNVPPPPHSGAIVPGRLLSSDTSTATTSAAASVAPYLPFVLEEEHAADNEDVEEEEEEEEEEEVPVGWGQDFETGDFLSKGAGAVASGVASAARASTPVKRTSTGQMVLSGQGLLNLCILVFTGLWAIHSIVTVDATMWRGWTLQETIMRLPWDNWESYEVGLIEHPIITKTAINGGIYLIGDWASQVNWGREEDIPLWDFDLKRTLRNGLIGALFGPIVHYYYDFSDTILPPSVAINRPFKIMMDQSIYFCSKCTMYITLVSLLRGDSIEETKEALRTRLKGVVTTGWRFWPFVHIFTYFLIPPRHRVLWVNCVDLLWTSILASMTSGTRMDDGAVAELDANTDATAGADASVDADASAADASVHAAMLEKS